MADVYTRLAHALDKMPHGYPSTEDGVELTILRKIFSPEDAAMTLRLKPIPEPAETIARRVRLPADEMNCPCRVAMSNAPRHSGHSAMAASISSTITTPDRRLSTRPCALSSALTTSRA